MHAALFLAPQVLLYAGSVDLCPLCGFVKGGFGKRSDMVMEMSVQGECSLTLS